MSKFVGWTALLGLTVFLAAPALAAQGQITEVNPMGPGTSGKIVITGGSIFGDDVKVKNSGSLKIDGATVGDDLDVKSSGSATVTNNNVTGDLKIKGSGICQQSGNTFMSLDDCP